MDLKATQSKLLELMVAFDDLCQTHAISYTLHGGTMLGAIREKGFIPWDDDMDIAMTRAEFQKLERLLDNNDCYHLVGNIKKQFRQIGDNEHWVDIFICDYISQRPIARKAKLLMLTVLDVMNRDKNSIQLSDFSQYNTGKQIAFKTAYLFGKLLSSKSKHQLYTSISENAWLGDKTWYVRSNDQYKGRQKIFPVAMMDHYVKVPFAHTQLSVSANYHELLTMFYGDNYMTPVKDERNTQVHDLVRSQQNMEL